MKVTPRPAGAGDAARAPCYGCQHRARAAIGFARSTPTPPRREGAPQHGKQAAPAQAAITPAPWRPTPRKGARIHRPAGRRPAPRLSWPPPRPTGPARGGRLKPLRGAPAPPPRRLSPGGGRVAPAPPLGNRPLPLASAPRKSRQSGVWGSRNSQRRRGESGGGSRPFILPSPAPHARHPARRPHQGCGWQWRTWCRGHLYG